MANNQFKFNPNASAFSSLWKGAKGIASIASASGQALGNNAQDFGEIMNDFTHDRVKDMGALNNWMTQGSFDLQRNAMPKASRAKFGTPSEYRKRSVAEDRKIFFEAMDADIIRKNEKLARKMEEKAKRKAEKEANSSNTEEAAK